MTAPLPAPAPGPATPLALTGPEVWLWLAGLFTAPPTTRAITHWRAEGSAEFDRLAADPALAAGIARVGAALATAEDAATVAARLGIAFGRLFLGIGGPETVSPYESAHTGSGRLFQAPVGEMERLLAAHDLSVDAELHEPADHLGVELALMARLVATDHPDRAVLAARLTAWVPRFCRLCVERDPTGFFGGAAEVLAATIAREAERAAVAFDETK